MPGLKYNRRRPLRDLVKAAARSTYSTLVSAMARAIVCKQNFDYRSDKTGDDG